MHLFDDTDTEIASYIMLKIAMYCGPCVVAADLSNKIRVARHDTPTGIKYIDSTPELIIGTYSMVSSLEDIVEDINCMRNAREPGYVDH